MEMANGWIKSIKITFIDKARTERLRLTTEREANRSCCYGLNVTFSGSSYRRPL
jgi:hypothetical protein